MDRAFGSDNSDRQLGAAEKPHNKAIFNFNEWFLEDKILLYIIKDILYRI